MNSDGSLRWLSPPVEGAWEEPPRISPDGELIFLRANALKAADGALMPLPLAVDQEMSFLNPTLAVGADGETYYLAGNHAIQWRLDPSGVTVVNAIHWDLGGFNIYLPSDSGIATDGAFWIYFDGSYTNTRLAWLDADRRLLANIEATLRRKQLLALDGNHVAYACSADGRAQCLALDRQRGQQLWSLVLPAGVKVRGGALTPGALVITTEDGYLYKLADSVQSLT